MFTKNILAIAAVAGSVLAAPTPQDNQPTEIIPIVPVVDAPAARTFAIFGGFDAHQGAYKSARASSVGECRDLCAADEICKTFTYVPNGSTCWMAKTLAVGSAGPSGANFFGVLGACDNPDTMAQINKNSYKASLSALCATDYAKYKYALFDNYDLRQGNFEFKKYASAEACAADCSGQACSGFSWNGNYCYKSKAVSLSASSPNSGITMGFLGTCASVNAQLPAKFKGTATCRD